MSVVTLKTDKFNRRNKSYIISGIEVKFDHMGLADVPERHVEKLLEGGLKVADDTDLERLKISIKPKAEQKADVDLLEEIKVLEEDRKILEERNLELSNKIKELEIENGRLADELQKALISKLDEVKMDVVETPEAEKVDEVVPEEVEDNNGVIIDDLKKDELIKLCEESELPEKEWKDLNVKALKYYLKTKLAE